MRVSTQDLVSQLQQLAERMGEAAVSEVRQGLAEALAGVARDVVRDGFEALAPDGCGAPIPEAEDSVSFAAGLRFAAQLVADREWDY